MINNNEYLNVFKLLEKYGFSYNEVVMIMDNCSFERVENDSLGMILDNGCSYLLNRGYSISEIRKMALLYPRCLIASDNKRKIIEDTFLELGMTFEEFKKLSIRCGNVYSYSKERIDEYIEFFRDLGFDDKYIIRVFKYVLFIFRSSVNKFKKLYNDMIEIGFTHKEIYTIAKGNPTFWTHNINKVKEFINTFRSLGFSLDEIKIILIKSSALIGYSDSTIRYKYNELKKLGLSEEELKYIISVYPTIINSDINRTEEILSFFKELGLYECLIKEPKNFFMQGIDTSYARYCLYIDMGKTVDKNSYKKLFYGWKIYKKLYNVDRDELLLRYPYNRDNFSRCKKK